MLEVLLFILFFVIIIGLIAFINWCAQTIKKARKYPKTAKDLSDAYEKIHELNKQISKLNSNQYTYNVPKLLENLRNVTAERNQYKALVDRFNLEHPDIQELENKKQEMIYDLGHQEMEFKRYSNLLSDQKRVYNNLTKLNDLAKPFSYEINRVFRDEYNISLFFDSVSNGELGKAFEKDIHFSDFNFSATIFSDNEKYDVSLKSCTCKHYQIHCKKNGTPCKHMVCFAYTLGLLQGYREEITEKTIYTFENLYQVAADVKAKRSELKELEKFCAKAKKSKEKLNNELQEIRKQIKSEKQLLTKDVPKRLKYNP